MANEAVMVQQFEENLQQVKLSNGTSISALTILKMSDANYGAASSADGDIFNGISTYEKIAGDDTVSMSVWKKGLFNLKNGVGTITAGDKVKISGANLIAVADDDVIEHGSQAFGVVQQDAAASEVVLVRIG